MTIEGIDRAEYSMKITWAEVENVYVLYVLGNDNRSVLACAENRRVVL